MQHSGWRLIKLLTWQKHNTFIKIWSEWKQVLPFFSTAEQAASRGNLSMLREITFNQSYKVISLHWNLVFQIGEPLFCAKTLILRDSVRLQYLAEIFTWKIQNSWDLQAVQNKLCILELYWLDAVAIVIMILLHVKTRKFLVGAQLNVSFGNFYWQVGSGLRCFIYCR